MTHVDERTARRVAEEARQTEWELPSFGKQLFLGDFRLSLIHPHPESDAAMRSKGERYLARVREFCETKMDARTIERDARIPDEVVKGLKQLGAFGMKIPEAYGGLGLNQLYYNKALMLFASAHPAVGAMLSAHQSIGVPQPVELFGTEEQKRAYLPRCVNEISAFLLRKRW